MTTDNVPKQAVLKHPDGWSIGGFAKGAGMCAPNMATMLSVITTDAVLDQPHLDHALRNAVGKTFNRLDVDGGTSTNDTVLLLSSGASGVTVSPDEFEAALTVLAADLVKQLQADAEGVTKHVSITVQGAATEAEAVAAAALLPKTTSARPRSSPPTRTGAGSRWRSATHPPRSTRRCSTSR